MTEPTVRIHDLSTNEIVDRDMNIKELADYEAHLARQAAKLEAEAQEAATKAALLERLGITADEAKLLLS
jgi:hypothetical protein